MRGPTFTRSSGLLPRDAQVQENCIDLVGRIADRGAEYVPAREWMRICFELLEMLKAHKKGIRRATVNTFGYIAKAIGPQARPPWLGLHAAHVHVLLQTLCKGKPYRSAHAKALAPSMSSAACRCDVWVLRGRSMLPVGSAVLVRAHLASMRKLVRGRSQDVLVTLLNNLKVQERQNRVCTTVAIAIVAETCSPFTVLPALMNEYKARPTRLGRAPRGCVRLESER